MLTLLIICLLLFPLNDGLHHRYQTLVTTLISVFLVGFILVSLRTGSHTNCHFTRQSFTKVEQIGTPDQPLAVKQPVDLTVMRFIQHPIKKQVNVVAYLVLLGTAWLVVGLGNALQVV